MQTEGGGTFKTAVVMDWQLTAGKMKQLLCLLLMFNSAHMSLRKPLLKKVCFGELGCFSTDPPFTGKYRPISVTPESPDKIKTRFILYTRESRDVPHYLDARYPKDVLTVWPNFKARPTKFMVHGFFQRIDTWMKEMSGELLKYGDYNTIIVDWSGGNQFPYTQATANTRIVGAQIAALINHLNESGVVPAADFHIIGHSLGAHIAGYAGERVPGLGRITGLDPAGPNFRDIDRIVRLDSTDAQFVDALHTNAAEVMLLGLGTTTLSGHADFFPNSGHVQPGCKRDASIPNNLQERPIKGILGTVLCSHKTAVQYYNESINSPCPFLANPCASEDNFKNNLCQTCGDVGCSYMGFHADKHKPPGNQTVKYYLTTGSSAPYCRYHYTIIVKFSSGTWPSVSGEASIAISGELFNSSWVSLTGNRKAKFSPGQSNTFYVDLPQDVGKVVLVSFKWQQVFSIFTLGKVFSVAVESISVHVHETSVRSQFCSEGQSVDSGSTTTLLKTC